ncbi:MAG: hypothetical protein M5U31_16300 [Acidimicrobiia bacterium]|nr:hypothetical protein [Acidimicrobiia bacterium]
MKHQPCRVGASDERFGIRRAEMVLVLFLCDSCRVRGFEQAAEIADPERRLHDPETAR